MTAGDDAQRQLQLLRDQVARLISRNLELQRRVEELERSQNELALGAVAASLTRALQTAEAAMAAEAQGGQRYVISELETTIRGVFGQRDAEMVLRMPRAETPLPSAQLGSVRLRLGHVPTAAADDTDRVFAAALEEAQAVFSAWERGAGVVAAREIVAQATQLLAMRSEWNTPAFGQALATFVAAAERFGATITRRAGDPLSESYRAATQQLRASAQAAVLRRRDVAVALSQVMAAARPLVERHAQPQS